MKIKKEQIIVLIGGIVVLTMMYLSTNYENTAICTAYFEEPCGDYSTSKHICSCESGERYLDGDMVLERNQMIHQLNDMAENDYWENRSLETIDLSEFIVG